MHCSPTNFSAVIGSSRTRLPVAWNTALATAAAAPVAPRPPVVVADAARAEGARVGIELVDEVDRDVGGDVGVDGEGHAGEVLREPAAERGLVPARLHRRHAPAPDDAADHLRARGLGIDDAPGAVGACRAAQAQEPERGIDAPRGGETLWEIKPRVDFRCGGLDAFFLKACPEDQHRDRKKSRAQRGLNAALTGPS